MKDLHIFRVLQFFLELMIDLTSNSQVLSSNSHVDANICWFIGKI